MIHVPLLLRYYALRARRPQPIAAYMLWHERLESTDNSARPPLHFRSEKSHVRKFDAVLNYTRN
eukprot:2471945-Pleurochrysis_carterae.AAC.2